jgi:hypothetical protein
LLRSISSRIHQTLQSVASKQKKTFVGMICRLAVAMQHAGIGTRTGLVAGTVFVIP